MAVPSLKDDLEQVELDLLLGGLARQFGYDFRGYARASLSRRVRLAMQRGNVRSISIPTRHACASDPPPCAAS